MIRFHQRGVTIIEVLISMAVFSMISAIVLYGFIDSRRVQDLRHASALIVADVRQVQTLALSNEPYRVCSNTGVGTSFGRPCASDTGCDGAQRKCGLVPAGGYGLSISTCSTYPCQFYLYGDIGKGTFTSNLPDPPDGQRSLGPDIIDPVTRTESLPPKVSVVSLSVTDASGDVSYPDTLSWNTVPPKPTTKFFPAGVSATICLEHAQTHLRQLVTMIAASGQVSDRLVLNCP